MIKVLSIFTCYFMLHSELQVIELEIQDKIDKTPILCLVRILYLCKSCFIRR